MKQIIVAVNNFTETPGARYRTDGAFSGQEFYEDYLEPQLEKVWKDKDKIILLDLDGVAGYASSFLSEVFTRTVREFKNKEEIQKKIQIKSEDNPVLEEIIQSEISDAKS